MRRDNYLVFNRVNPSYALQKSMSSRTPMRDDTTWVRGTASCSTSSRSSAWSARSVTTSTGQPSRSSKSAISPPGKKKERSGPVSTSKSTSLDGEASPRAREPKTRRFCTPCRAAIALMASRFAVSRGSTSMEVGGAVRERGRKRTAPGRDSCVSVRAGIAEGDALGDKSGAVTVRMDCISCAFFAQSFSACPRIRGIRGEKEDGTDFAEGKVRHQFPFMITPDIP